MFDLGFSELLLVSIVALLVIGPERLPETIRTIMLWLGRIRRTFTSIKAELEQEIGADDIRRQLHNEAIMKDIKETKETISDAFKEADQSIDEFKHSINDTIDRTKESIKDTALDKTAETNKDPTSPVTPPSISDSTQDDEPERRTS